MYPIPNYARRIEYLESTGTQYIDTGIDAAVDVDMSLDAVSLNTGSTAFFVMGVFTTSSNSGYALFCSSDGRITGSVGKDVRVRADGIDWNTRRLVELRKGELIVGGTSYGLPSPMPTSLLPGNHIWLMQLNGIGVTLSGHPGRLYGSKIYKSGVLVRDFRPVRIGSVGYLYDRVSGQLFGNAGTGDFVLGPDTFQQGVVPTRMMVAGVHDALPYTREIEYLESTGTQYIDTGVLIGPTTRIESSFACTSSSRPKTASLYYVTEQSPKINGVRTNNAGYLIAVVGGVGNQNGYDPISPRTIKTVTDFSTGYVFIRLQQGDSYIRDMSKTGSPLSEANTISMYIFANNNGGVANSFGAFRFMSMRVWESGALVHDYIPVRKGTTGYLYDRVTKQLFGNAGTGSFVLGPDK